MKPQKQLFRHEPHNGIYGDCHTLEELLRYQGATNPDAYYLMGGCSPRGTNHTVICLGGGLEWDPHPDGGFLVGPLDHGFWEITYFVPLALTKVAA
jgi:hypothetical protein